ncbi:MAG: NAD-dependent DNA ligase LigA [Promethearchaeota archaeon]
MQNKTRILELEDILRRASSAYYGDGDSVLDDQQFDKLRDELEDLDPQNPFLAQVGAPTDSALTKVQHTIPMGSLKKITTRPEFDTWRSTVSKTASNLEMVVQLKLDGLSVELVYEKGRFKQAITRGDGQEGEDVTHTIRKSKDLPRVISLKDRRVSVRCEAMLRIDAWKTHFAEKANPRNAASGLVRRTDAKGAEHLSLCAFDVLFDKAPFKTEVHRIAWLKAEGFRATPNKIAQPDDVEAVVDAIQDKRDRMPIEIDGAVVKLNDIAEQEKLGEHNGRPYWARAWKFPAMGGHTTLIDVEWSVGTQGTINPIAKVEPVSVGGTTIQNVTLHNIDEIERLGIQIGDEIEVIRAGDVIPKIVRVVSKGKKRKKITIDTCPACGSALVRKRDPSLPAVRLDPQASKLIKRAPRLYCTNADNCVGTKFKKIQKWVKKRGIMYLGDSNLQILWDTRVVRSVSDLYLMTEARMTTAGVGKGMAKKILQQIDNSRTCSLADLIGSLSLDMLGRSEASNLIAQGVDTLGEWKFLTAAQIEGMPGYQRTKAKRISDAVQANWSLIEAVAQELTITSAKPKPASNKLAGKSFVVCLTGSMSRPRKQIAVDIEAAGHCVSDRVSKEITYLCQADPNIESSKSKKAKKLGIPIISEKQLVDML